MTKSELIKALHPFSDYDCVILVGLDGGWSNIDGVYRDGSNIAISCDDHTESVKEQPTPAPQPNHQREAHRTAMQRAIRKHAELTAVITRLDDALADIEDIAHGDLGLMVSQARTLCRLDLMEEVEP